MRVQLLVGVFFLSSSLSFKHDGKIFDHKYINSFMVTERRQEENGRQGREIVEIISDPTTVSTLPHYPSECTSDKHCETVRLDTTPMPTFKPYTQEELNAILKRYVENNRKLPESATHKLANLYMEEPINILEGEKEKSKSWQLLHSQTHHHPYDDKSGWVTLEPVPWSASQIQKWEPNRRPPQIPDWDSGQGGGYKPSKWHDRPWNKPIYEYKPSSFNRPSWQDNWGSGSDIITDGRPSSFPEDTQGKRPWFERPSDEHKEYLPGDGDGRWVLLSSTKGYGAPHRKTGRALSDLRSHPTAQVKSHRSVRLTVLPPINGTTNTTTAHGGLLEVEEGSQSVDEAQREHAAKMLRLSTTNKTGQQVQEVKKKRGANGVKRSPTFHVYPIKPEVARNNNAVIAAVGAGMIPATMAMLLPMVLGRRRRRSLPPFKTLPSYEAYIPNIMYYQHE